MNWAKSQNRQNFNLMKFSHYSKHCSKHIMYKGVMFSKRFFNEMGTVTVSYNLIHNDSVVHAKF